MMFGSERKGNVFQCPLLKKKEKKKVYFISLRRRNRKTGEVRQIGRDLLQVMRPVND